MKTGNLRINQLSPAAFERYLRYLEAMDARDVKAYAEFLADNCSLQMNNDPPVESKTAIVQMLTPYWNTFRSIEHELLNIYGTDTSYVLEALNHYERTDGGKVTVRAVAFTDLDDAGKVKSVRLYTDVSSVFQ